MVRNCIIVDGFSTGRFLPAELWKYDCSTIHVLSSKKISPFFQSSYFPEQFEKEFVFAENCNSETLAQFDPEFVIAGSEPGVYLADRITHDLGLRGNSFEQSSARRDKQALAAALKKAGLRCIEGIKSRDVAEICAWRRRNSFEELVLKPVDSGGTEDVYFCKSDLDIVAAAKKILGKWNVTGSFNEQLLAQERIRGNQYTVNAICCLGQFYVGEVWSYETVEVRNAGSICSHEWFFDGCDATSLMLSEYLSQVATAIGIVEGPIHAEIIVDAKGPVAVDVAARMQGAMSPEATLLAAGHNHITLTAMSYAASDAFADYVAGNSPYRRQSQSLCVSLISDAQGTVIGVPGLEKIKTLKTYSAAIGFNAIGSQLTKTRDLSSTPGIIYLTAEDPEFLQQDYDRIRQMQMDEIFELSN